MCFGYSGLLWGYFVAHGLLRCGSQSIFWSTFGFHRLHERKKGTANLHPHLRTGKTLERSLNPKSAKTAPDGHFDLKFGDFFQISKACAKLKTYTPRA